MQPRGLRRLTAALQMFGCQRLGAACGQRARPVPGAGGLPALRLGKPGLACRLLARPRSPCLWRGAAGAQAFFVAGAPAFAASRASNEGTATRSRPTGSGGMAPQSASEGGLSPAPLAVDSAGGRLCAGDCEG